MARLAWSRSLLFAALLLIAPVVGSGSASGGPPSDCEEGRRLAGQWWCHEWEEDFTNAIIGAILVVMAIVFEKTYHFWMHRASKSYVYGKSLLSEEELEAQEQARIFGYPLMVSLMHRMGSEFMVLGFLAFCVWSSNQMGLFDALASSGFEIPGVRLPTTGTDYLHAAEKVHIQLFLGMLAYFMLCFQMARGCVHNVAKLERLRLEWIEQLQREGTSVDLQVDSYELRSFKLWRAHFIGKGTDRVLLWRQTNPAGFLDVLHSFGIQKAPEEVKLAELQTAFTGCFSFATYLAFSIREAAEDTIALKTPTMVCIVIQKLLLAGNIYFAQRRQLETMMFFLYTAIGFVILMVLLSERIKCGLHRPQRDLEEGNKNNKIPGLGCLPRIGNNRVRDVNPEAIVLTVLQTLLFFISLAFVLVMFSRGFYLDVVIELIRTGSPAELSWDLAELGGALVLVCFFLAVLGRLLPDWAAVCAMPPFLDHQDDDMIRFVVKAGGAQGALWAPYVDEKNNDMVWARAREAIPNIVRDLVMGSLEDGHGHDAPGPETERQEELLAQDIWTMLTQRNQNPRQRKDTHDVSYPSQTAAEQTHDERVAQRLNNLHLLLMKEVTGSGGRRNSRKSSIMSQSMHSEVQERMGMNRRRVTLGGTAAVEMALARRLQADNGNNLSLSRLPLREHQGAPVSVLDRHQGAPVSVLDRHQGIQMTQVTQAAGASSAVAHDEGMGVDMSF